MTTENNIWAVIMAGGSGTRFWPVSRQAAPKQLVRIVGDTTMIQATVTRLQPAIPADRILIVTTEQLAEETRKQLPMLPAEHIIAEPVGRDTAACVCLAAILVQAMDPNATMILLPADHVISPADDFQKALLFGAQAAADGSLVTFGVAPRFPATCYGYIEHGTSVSTDGPHDIYQVKRFVEKPDAERAQTYIENGSYSWNSGIFIWRCDTVLSELRTHCSWLTEALMPLAAAWGTEQFNAQFAEIYQPLKKISIDYALLEKADNIKVVTASFAWDDVGSWDAIYDHLPANDNAVIEEGCVHAINCRDSLLMNRSSKTLAAIGLDNMSVVVTDDAVLVCKRGESQDVKDIVSEIEDRLK